MALKDKSPPKIYFDKRGSYWLELAVGQFLPLDKHSISLHLRRAGLSKDKYVMGLNELENALVVAQLERAVDYAGPLAGHRQGLFKSQAGEKILVTSEARSDIFEPISRCDTLCEFIDRYLGQLFGPEQFDYAMAWLKVARQSLARGEFRPGQMFTMIGPSGSGKSLYHAFITEVLGGRMGKPYRYMTGETPFNSDFAGTEHLVIEDETWSTDIRARWKFAAAIKDLTVTEMMSVHAKGHPAIVLPVSHRLSMSINDQPEHLQNLPLLTSDIADKLMLFKCSPAELPDDRRMIWGNILKEMPAFLSWLNRWQLPKAIQPQGADMRYGVARWHHPDIVEQLTHVSPESRLENLLDEILDFNGIPVRFTAGEIEVKLRNSAFGPTIPSLFYFPGACATIMGRLSVQKPERFIRETKNGRAAWRILPRKEEKEKAA